MSIVIDTSTSNSLTSNSTSSSWSHTCSGSDRILIVVITDPFNGQSHSSCTYNGVSMTQAKLSSSYIGCSTSIWYLINPATGSNTVLFNGGNSKWQCGAMSFTGVNQTTPLSGTPQQTGGTSVTSVSVSMTTLTDNAMMVGGGGGTTNLSLTTLTQRYESDTTGAKAKGGTYLKATAGAQSTGFTLSSGRASYVIMALRETPSILATIKTINSTAKADLKTLNNQAIAGIKSYNGKE